MSCLLQLASSDELESKFNRLEGDDVDDELASMKKGLLKGGSGSGPSSKQSLPEGRPVKSVTTTFPLCLLKSNVICFICWHLWAAD